MTTPASEKGRADQRADTSPLPLGTQRSPRTADLHICVNCSHSEGAHFLSHDRCHGTPKSGPCDCTGYAEPAAAEAPDPPKGYGMSRFDWQGRQAFGDYIEPEGSD